jgi:hypothetical protein
MVWVIVGVVVVRRHGDGELETYGLFEAAVFVVIGKSM